MTRLRVLIFILIGLLSAGATASAAGVNLSWGDCGVNGLGVETFSCDTDAGYHDLIASVVTGTDMTQVIGVQVTAYLSVGQGNTLPDWWLLGSTQCRSGAASLDLDYSDDPTTCPWILETGAAAAAAGGYAWDAPYIFPHQARLRWIVAIPPPYASIQSDVEYTVGRLRILNTGTGSCSGCQMPACIGLTEVRIVQPAGVGDLYLYEQIARTHVGWQCPSEVYTETSEACFITHCGTPTTSPTWGLIKSMYR